MATVAEISARLNAEGDQPPWVSTIRRTTLEDTGLFDPAFDFEEDDRDSGVLAPLTEKEYEVGNQPTAAPTRKVTVGALAGALTVLAVYLLGLAGLDLPAEGAAALTTLVSFVLAYLVPSADQDV